MSGTQPAFCIAANSCAFQPSREDPLPGFCLTHQRHDSRAQYICLGDNRPHQWAEPRNPSPPPTQPVQANVWTVSKGHLGGPWLV